MRKQILGAAILVAVALLLCLGASLTQREALYKAWKRVQMASERLITNATVTASPTGTLPAWTQTPTSTLAPGEMPTGVAGDAGTPGSAGPTPTIAGGLIAYPTATLPSSPGIPTRTPTLTATPQPTPGPGTPTWTPTPTPTRTPTPRPGYPIPPTPTPTPGSGYPTPPTPTPGSGYPTPPTPTPGSGYPTPPAPTPTPGSGYPTPPAPTPTPGSGYPTPPAPTPGPTPTPGSSYPTSLKPSYP